MTLKQRIEIKKRLKEKGEEINIKPPNDANKKLDVLVDEVIKDVRNLKEDEEIYPEIKKPIENEIPQEIKKEFDNLAKSLENKKTMTEKENIIYEVRELRNDIDILNRRITKRQTEDMDIMKMIFDRLRFIKGHISKWFIGVLIISFISGGVVFTTVYHNWDSLTPIIDKITAVFKIANSAKNLSN